VDIPSLQLILDGLSTNNYLKPPPEACNNGISFSGMLKFDIERSVFVKIDFSAKISAESRTIINVPGE
jgi:hypothetical protein